ncbi:Beta-glucosidase (SUN), partial [Cryomyces antarcticus]
MKYAVVLTILTAGLSLAQPHRHAHRHAHVDKRSPTADVVNVPGPTVVVFELNGKAISESDVQEGLKNGTLKWAGDGALSVAPSSTVASSTSAPSPISSAKPTSTSISVVPASSTSVAASTSAAASSVAASSS